MRFACQYIARVATCHTNIAAMLEKKEDINMKKILLSVATMIMVAFGAVAQVMAEETALTPVQQTSQENHDAWLQAHGRPTNDQAIGVIVGVLPVGMILAIVVNVGRTVLLLGGSTKKTSAAVKNEALASADGSYNAAAQSIAMMDNAAAQDAANNSMMF